MTFFLLTGSVPDPNLDPDPHGSGSISQRFGSGSFYKASKNSKNNLDSYCFVTSFGLFIFEKGCKCTLKYKQIFFFFFFFFFHLEAQ
jgi:hypothetical protein